VSINDSFFDLLKTKITDTVDPLSKHQLHDILKECYFKSHHDQTPKSINKGWEVVSDILNRSRDVTSIISKQPKV